MQMIIGHAAGTSSASMTTGRSLDRLDAALCSDDAKHRNDKDSFLGHGPHVLAPRRAEDFLLKHALAHAHAG